MKITIPELSLVVLIGSSGAGKSTFARKHFRATEVLSSDFCRGLVCDDENSLEATNDAFETLHFIAAKRLQNARLTVVDATNVQQEARAPLVQLAREHYVMPVAIVLDVPEELCHERNAARPDRNFGPHVVRSHSRQLRRSLRHLSREGFRHVHVLSPEDIEYVEIERTKLWNNRRDESGPFDIIGDVHGCADELEELLRVLAYQKIDGVWRHESRKLVFLGDLVDRGPDTPRVLEIAMNAVEADVALCVPGNHDDKLKRLLQGKKVKVAHGLEETLAQFDARDDDWKKRVESFLDGLISHYVLDGGRLVVAHAGLKEAMQGRAAGRVREFCLYGETTGEIDEFGLPVRYEWANEYRGGAAVIYGHTPVPETQWLNNTLNVDTGCVFGGKLTALQWPEKEIVAVAARAVYAEPKKPFLDTASTRSAQHEHDDLLDLSDVLGKRILHTRFAPTVTIREENALAALEVMSRFAADPKWLIHLPPTMSPCETSREDGFLEHPAQAFDYYRKGGANKIVCEEKHMGSRAIVTICRDETTAQKRFGVDGGDGIVTTRTGRRFFDGGEMEAALLQRLRDALTAVDWWREYSSDWFCFDCELMPWSAKAQELIQKQYAPVGAASQAALVAALESVQRGVARLPDDEILQELQSRTAERLAAAQAYARAFRHYCWPVTSVEDLRLAPFHLLAAEGQTFFDRTHQWHMETLAALCERDGENGARVLVATPFRVVDLSDTAQIESATDWWLELTARGGEGMVVKPLDFLTKRAPREKQSDATGENMTAAPAKTPGETRAANADSAAENAMSEAARTRARSELGGWLQPAVKCRGREYLRIIYGPEYAMPENLSRLRSRGLGAKRSLALREWSLGLESLQRFVEREPLRRVHECVFGVLALESEPVDPRL